MTEMYEPLSNLEVSNWKKDLEKLGDIPSNKLEEEDGNNYLNKLNLRDDICAWNIMNKRKWNAGVPHHFAKLWKVWDNEPIFLELLECDDAILLRHSWCVYYNLKCADYLHKQIKNFYFLTITGDKRIPENPDNISKMLEFGDCIFSNDNYKRYERVVWNIETGKHEDNPNLHLHAVIVFTQSTKNFVRDCRTRWAKSFKKYGSNILNKSYTIKGPYLQDKLDYLNNKDKSILHMNYKDLGILRELN